MPIIFRFRLDPILDLREIAAKCPLNYTGADFYALCSDAMLKAMYRKAMEIEASVGMAFFHFKIKFFKIQ